MPCPFFFQAPEGALHATPVNRYAESLLDQADEGRCPDAAIARAELLDEVHHLTAELVSAARTALCGQEAGQSTLAEGCLRLIERRAGEAERAGHSRDRGTVHLDPADHLVLDLQEIPRVEEIRLTEDLVADAFRPGIEEAALSEGVELIGAIL